MYSMALSTKESKQWNKFKDINEPEDPREPDLQINKGCDQWNELSIGKWNSS